MKMTSSHAMASGRLLTIVVLMLCATSSVFSQVVRDQSVMDTTASEQLLKDLSAEFSKLQPRCIRPAEGFLKYDYLIPSGFYKQMWDWDGFFIGSHLASRSKADAKYLKWWTLNFVTHIDSLGYAPGCMTTKGPRPIFGKFALKPFLSQGAYFAAVALNDFTWIDSVYDGLKEVLAYRDNTQFDPKYGLYFWDLAIQSGADNNPVLTNDENDRSAIIGVDICTFQLREFLAMSRIADTLGKKQDAEYYRTRAHQVTSAMMKYLWFREDTSFFNVRRDNGKAIKRVSYSNFIPLFQRLLPTDLGRAMIAKYLLNKDQMLSPYGIRSLSRQDPDYNNVCEIIPYSNWQGPIWINANFMFSIALKRYGFDREAKHLAVVIVRMLLSDIRSCGSMHENYDAETGVPLAPTAEQSPGGVFTGFVGWNLLAQEMLEGAVENKWLLLEL
jgi:alpha,alpha-trehalase